MQIQDLINIEYAETLSKNIYYVIGSFIFIVLGSLWFIFGKKSTTSNQVTPKSSKSNKQQSKKSNNNYENNKKPSKVSNIDTTKLNSSTTTTTTTSTTTTTTTSTTTNTPTSPTSPNSTSSNSHSLFIKTIKSLGDTIESIKFSPDGKFLSFSGGDRNIKLFLTDSLLTKSPQSFNLNLPFDYATSISWGNKCIYASLRDTQKLICYNILDSKNQEGKTYEMSWSVPLDTKSCIKSICSSPSSPYILTCGDDTILKVWTLKGQLLQTINTGQIKNFNASSTLDGRFFGVAAFSSEVKIYESILKKDGSLDQCKRVMSLPGKSSINSLCFSTDGTKVVTASSKEEGIKLWNLNIKYQLDVDPECIYSIKSETGPIDTILIAPDSSVFVGLNQNTISFYNLSNGSLIDIINTSPQQFKSITWSPDSKYVITGGQDRLLYLWANPKLKSK